MLLEEMTWQEINALDRSIIVVATFGAVEQHGAHLPLETDALIGREITRRLDVACDGCLLVLPTQWLGLSLHHMSFSGTLTASVDTFLAMAVDLLGSVARGLPQDSGHQLARRQRIGAGFGTDQVPRAISRDPHGRRHLLECCGGAVERAARERNRRHGPCLRAGDLACAGDTTRSGPGRADCS